MLSTIREQLAKLAKLRKAEKIVFRVTMCEGDLQRLLDDWERNLRDEGEDTFDVPYHDMDLESHIQMMLRLAAAENICHKATEEGLIEDGFKPDPAKN